MTTTEGVANAPGVTVAALGAPPGRLLNGVATALFVVTLWQGSERTGRLDPVILVGSAWFFLILLWFYRLAVEAESGMLRRGHALRWLWVPTLFVAAIVVVFSGYAMQARFGLSRSSLDAAADAAMDRRAPPPGWFGLYPVDSITLLADGVRFDVVGQYPLVRDTPLDSNDTSVRYEPIEGRWSMEILLFSSD